MSGPERVLKTRKYSKGRRAYFFSDRSGMPFPYRNVCVEPGTGLIVDKSESDGQWNRTEMFKDIPVPPDAEKLEYVRPGILATDYYS